MAGGKRAPSLARNSKPLPSRPRGRYPSSEDGDGPPFIWEMSVEIVGAPTPIYWQYRVGPCESSSARPTVCVKPWASM